MKKAVTKTVQVEDNDMRTEYDFTGGVRGKYYKRAIAGTNLVLIEPDLAKAFPDTDSVNRALRTLLDAASVAAGPARRRRSGPHKRLKQTAGKRGRSVASR